MGPVCSELVSCKQQRISGGSEVLCLLDVKQSKEFWAWDVLQGHEDGQLELSCAKGQNTGHQLANFQHTDCLHEHPNCPATGTWPGVSHWRRHLRAESRGTERLYEMVIGSL